MRKITGIPIDQLEVVEDHDGSRTALLRSDGAFVQVSELGVGHRASLQLLRVGSGCLVGHVLPVEYVTSRLRPL